MNPFSDALLQRPSRFDMPLTSQGVTITTATPSSLLAFSMLPTDFTIPHTGASM